MVRNPPRVVRPPPRRRGDITNTRCALRSLTLIWFNRFNFQTKPWKTWIISYGNAANALSGLFPILIPLHENNNSNHFLNARLINGKKKENQQPKQQQNATASFTCRKFPGKLRKSWFPISKMKTFIQFWVMTSRARKL